jgi:RND family efflux transporter MFP subunit
MFKLFLTVLITGSTLFANLTVSGRVISDNEKMITSRFMGFITDVNAHEGDFVTKGQLLYSIDSKEIDTAIRRVQLGISQAQLSLQMNQSQLNNLLLNLARHKRLFKKSMVSKYEVENLELATKNMRDMVKISKKQVEQANAQLAEVKNQYKYLNIKAPNDGVIIKKNINAGEMAMPGMPAFILSDLTNLKIVAEISERELKLVPYGKSVIVKIPSIDFNTIGTVTAIIPSSNPMTHTFRIKISFKTDNNISSIYPGMYSTIAIADQKR